MKGWSEVKLKGVSQKIEYGYTASAEEINSGVKFVRITDIVPDFIDWDQIPYCQISESDKAKYALDNYDIVIARTGATVGYAKQIRGIPVNAVFASYLIRVKLKNEVNKRFIGLLVESSIYKEYIKTIAGGAAQPNANAQDLTSFPFYLPPLPIQKKIAAILSAYDDLIENNNRRIAILEKMAEELYREWFVRLRFPGHEKIKIVKGVPEGWAIGCVGDIYNVKSGFAFKSEDLGEIGYPVIKITNIQNGYIDIGSIQRFSGNLVSRILQFEIFDLDLLIAMTGAQVGKTGIFIGTGERFFLNQRVGKFFAKYKNKNNVFMSVFCQTKEFSCQIDNFALGAAQPNISGDQIESIKLLIPTRTLLEDFADKTDPVEKEIVYIKKQNNILSISRDRLLSRLMSGKIDVENMDIQFPESMRCAERVEAQEEAFDA